MQKKEPGCHSNKTIIIIVVVIIIIIDDLHRQEFGTGPLLQSTKLNLTLTLTLTDTGGAVLTLMLGYRKI